MLRIGDPRGWWLLALAGLLLVVFLLRGRRRRTPSSLYFLIRRLAERLSVAHPRLRLRRRVAQALFAAAGVATAVAGLAPHTVSDAQPLRELVIVDLSPSLGTMDGGAPRLNALRRHLGRYLDRLQQQDTVLLVTAGPQAAATPALGADALRAAVAHLDYADAPADVAGAVRLAAAMAHEKRYDHVLLFTDRPGRWEQGEGAAEAGAPPMQVVTFGATAPNTGIEAFDLEADPLIPAAFDIYLRVSCPEGRLEQETRPVTLSLRNNDRVLQQIRRECVPGTSQEILLDDVALEPGQAEVRLDPGGAYPGDDRVFAGVSDAPTAKVVLVGHGSTFLRAALEALPGMEIAVSGPEETLPRDPRAIYVFDGTVPRGPLPDKALFIQPDQALEMLEVQTWRTYPERIDWEPDDPLLRAVDLEGLTVKGLVAYAAAPGFKVAATADGWPLILARGEGGRRWVVLAFDPAETNLVYTPAFPVLIANIVRWLGLFTAGERPFSRVGETVVLPGAARGGWVLTPGGTSFPVADDTVAPTFLETRHPGRYQVSGPGGGALGSFYVNVVDPAVTAAAAADGYGRGTADLPPDLQREPLRREFAPALALLALALLASEIFFVTARASQRESP